MDDFTEMTELKELSKNKVFAGTLSKYSFQVSSEVIVVKKLVSHLRRIVVCAGRFDSEFQPLLTRKCKCGEQGAFTDLSRGTNVHRGQWVGDALRPARPS